MTMADGTVIEGTAEELAKLQELTGISEESEEPAEKPSIKVGDYAKVFGETYCNAIIEGSIVEVTQEADCEGYYRIDLIDGSGFDYAKTEALEKIELSEADLVFIENGREPGEYKKGDIARVIKSPFALPVGTIFEVSDVHEGDVYDSSPQRFVYMTPEKQLEPITFVEKRADKIV